MAIPHLKRGILTIRLDADWTRYTDVLPQGSIALGIVTQGEETGALVYVEATQTYLMIQPERIYRLLPYKVKAALKVASPDN
ncbi:MAG: hypothetical protein KDJ31_13295 [Candidatus Competibacteraceae bacterium]|nr:hypothetical protein [Candidatus Competibacteraceae bacterium]